MENRIIVDSCCDMTSAMKQEMGIISVPLTMMLGDREFCDDDTLNLDEFMSLVNQYSGKVGSASPAPYMYQEAIGSAENAYVVTLSSKLSGSYNNAVIGSNEAVENGANPACILDSKSASAGETLIAIKLHELISDKTPREQIEKTIRSFIEGMKTYFVFENYDNLQKNGRMSKVTGSLIQMLNIKLLMGDDGNGEIALYEKCRGAKKVLQQLISRIADSGKETENENLVICHCNNTSLAEQLMALIKERFSFKKIYIVPTGGLSSLYADDKGIIMAF